MLMQHDTSKQINGLKAEVDELKRETPKQIDELKTEIEDSSNQLSELKTELEELKEDTPKHMNELKAQIEELVQQDNANQIDELKTEVEELKARHKTYVMLRRKDVGNPIDYFEKTFAEYQQGFEAYGEISKLRDA